MSSCAFYVLLLVAGCYAGYGHEEHAVDYYAPANYHFHYGVADPHTGDKKEQYETRHGDVVKGSYSLHEPDGTVRVVEYTSDPHTGFNAIVKRIGHASHPGLYKKYSGSYGHGYDGYGSGESYVGTTKYGSGSGYY